MEATVGTVTVVLFTCWFAGYCAGMLFKFITRIFEHVK